MKKFIQLPYESRKQMGINGRQRMEKLFDKNIVVEKILENIL